MLRSLIIAIVICPLLGMAATDAGGNGPRLSFQENRGQWPAQVLYRAMVPGGAVFIEDDALTCVIRSGGHRHAVPEEHGADGPVRMHAYRVHFEGGRANGHRSNGKQAHYENYFLGNDPTKWATRVGVFQDVDLNEVYPGIDLHVSGAGDLKYDWVVRAGSDPSAIVQRYEGQDGLSVKDGRLIVSTSAGDVIEQRPVAWQEAGGVRRSVDCLYALKGDRVHFEFPEGYDARYDLVIDPILAFSTYTGSTADNFGFTATYDASGHLYGGGIVFGIGYPTTVGVLQSGFAGNTIDIGITKFSPDGSALIWSTYLGGATGNESPHSLVVDGNDELYVLGTSGSSDFPTTAGCFNNVFGAGPPVPFGIGYGYSHINGSDIVVAHLSADATALIGSTYVGGSQADGVNLSASTAYNYGDTFRGEIVLDPQENPIVATVTLSSNMPVTPNAPFPTYGGGPQDGYLFRMDPQLSTMLWATYYGGSNVDACYGVQTDANGEIFVTGGSDSNDLPMAGSPFDGTANGATDGFIARFSADGSALLSTTYLGTNAYDQSYFVQLDQTGNVYVVGQTHGAYPVTPGKYANPGSSQFIHKLSHDLSTSLWSTRIGNGSGTEDISPTAFLVSDCGQIYFSGWGGFVNTFGQGFLSTTVGLPVSSGAYQTTTDGSDFWLVVLNAEANSLAYATFFGGGISSEHVDGGTSRFDKNGIVYQAVCAGCGSNDDFPTSPGAWSNTNNSTNCNLGVFKMDFEQGIHAGIGGQPLSGCAPATIQFLNTGTGSQWIWNFGDGSPASTDQAPSHAYPTAGVYTVTLIAIDSMSCNISDTLSIQVNIIAPVTPQPAFTYARSGDCDPNSVTFTNTTPGIGNAYVWDFGDGNTSTTANPTHNFPGPGSYIVTLTVTENTCSTSATTQQTITVVGPVALEALFTSTQTDYCTGLTVTTVNLSTGPSNVIYTWDFGDGTVVTGNSVTHTYAIAGNYLITLLAFDALCNESDTYSVPVEVVDSPLLDGGFIVPNVFSPNGDGVNDHFFPMPGASGGRIDLQVFDRWGLKMHETSGSYHPWDGRTPAGSEAPDGVYYYIVDYDLPCLDQHLKGRLHGAVQMLR